jgi:DNA-binding Lrp family transcriptional regulator
MKATNQTVQRSFNRSLVLQKVRTAGKISRVDLSRALGLEKSSITAIVGELLDQGLVREAGGGVSPVSVGRRPVALELNTGYCCFLGIEVQPSRYHAVILDLGGRILHEENGPLADPQRPFEAKLGEIYARLNPAVRSLPLPLAAVGVGIPGLVDPLSGRVNLSVPHALEAWDFAPVSNPWGVPATIENDANCCAWATLMDGDPTNGGDFLALLLEFQDPNPRLGQQSGVSLGIGVVIGGEVHYGRNFEAGEFRSLYWREGHRSQTGLPDADLERIARDPEVLDRYLAEMLLNLIPVGAVLAPERILLGGEAGRAFDRIPALLGGPLAGTWLGRPGMAARITRSPRGTEAVAVGAAARLVMTLFNSRSLSKSASQPGLDWDSLFSRFGTNREIPSRLTSAGSPDRPAGSSRR